MTGNSIESHIGNALFAKGHGREIKEVGELVMFKGGRKPCSETKADKMEVFC